MLRRAAAAPGVEAAGVGSNGGAIMLLTIEGEPDSPPEQKPRGVLSSASEGYASALGLRIVKGRWLTDHEPTPVFVINETLARQAFPGTDPIGKRIRLPFVDASDRVRRRWSASSRICAIRSWARRRSRNCSWITPTREWAGRR